MDEIYDREKGNHECGGSRGEACGLDGLVGLSPSSLAPIDQLPPTDSPIHTITIPNTSLQHIDPSWKDKMRENEEIRTK